MKRIAVAVVAAIFSLGVAVGENVEKQEIQCKPLVSLPMEQHGKAPVVSPAFFVTTQADYKACQKIARKKGGRVIIVSNVKPLL